jgi:hypothetical protein
MRTVLAFGILGLNLFAQRFGTGTGGLFRPVEADLFHDCGGLATAATKLARAVPDRAFVMELFPKNEHSLFYPFASETVITPLAIQWIDKYQPTNFPYALLYWVDGKHTLRCRDDQHRFTESSGPDGDVLQLRLSAGNAVIWHFFVTPVDVAHVFVVTQIPLNKIDGQELMREVKRQLGARYVFIYTRNDPWFFGYSPDTLPYIFTESFKRISELEYLGTNTAVCDSDTGCRVWPSRK